MIKITDLTLQRGNKQLLQHAHLTLHVKHKVGIIGANGCGKSSLLALLRNELQADEGQVEIPEKWTIAHVAQETPILETSALDYVLDGDAELRQLEQALANDTDDGMRQAELHAQYEAIDGYTANARAAQILHGLGFSAAQEAMPVKHFSGGWRMRLNLAQALMCRSDLLLLDEPTNHLDLDAVLWFEQWLKHYQGTLLLISHDRDFLDNTVEAIAHVEQQKINLYTGNYADFERQRAENLARQQADYEKQQREIAHMQHFVDRFRAKATKAKQAQSRLKALDRMELIAAAHIDSPFKFQFFEPESQANLLLDVKQTQIGYGETVILDKVKMRITAGARIGLLGPNGAGKSTLIKFLAEELDALDGTVQRHEHLKIGYFAQHQLEYLRLDESPLQHIQSLSPQVSEQQIRNFLGGFAFQGDMATDPIEPFSGGEKARLALALLVWQKPNLLLLDEPTNHLDLEMRHALTTALQAYQGALVVVSHDRHLLRTTVDQLWLVAHQRVQPYEGDLDEYKQWLLEHRSQERKAQQPKEKTAQKQDAKQQREQKRSLQNKLKQLEKALDKWTAEKSQIESQLATPEVYNNLDKAQDYSRQQQHIIQQLQETEELWLEVTESLEALS
ncbi:ATP-binding cassette domain-containing protein [Candidatus Albibeggiatoa sp. nov. NOAA]|uniref:ATP-binding cassette domain-containing protein n=1 Tax=Candidatus Albibeggiatoa sp. nov. NOAA TaxID=3162724 RepID=UPI0032F57368|nr:ATP-binding cassette domain-containing protein [Thiotrichaceae bacterium]